MFRMVEAWEALLIWLYELCLVISRASVQVPIGKNSFYVEAYGPWQCMIFAPEYTFSLQEASATAAFDGRTECFSIHSIIFSSLGYWLKHIPINNRQTNKTIVYTAENEV